MILKLIVPAALLGMVVLYGAWLYKSVRDLVPKIKEKLSARSKNKINTNNKFEKKIKERRTNNNES